MESEGNQLNSVVPLVLKCFLCQDELVEEAREKHVCDKSKKVVCPFHFVGCQNEFVPEELVIHIHKNLMEHLHLACTAFVATKTENEELKRQMKVLEEKNAKFLEYFNEFKLDEEENVDILGEVEKADLGDIHSYSSQLMEKLLDKKDAKSIIYVLRNLESKEKTDLLQAYETEIIEVAKRCVWIPDSTLDDIIKFTPSPATSKELLELCPSILKVCLASLDLAKSFTLPINCADKPQRIAKWIQISESIKDLLLFTKLKLSTFVNSLDYNIVGLCEDFLSHSNIINEIVRTTKMDYEISFQDLLDIKKVRQIRDCLVANKRFILANNISMKCRIETESVFVAWGLHLLKKGNFADARKKFDVCLAPLTQSNANTIAHATRTTQPGLFPKIDSSVVLDSIIAVLTEGQEKASPKNYEECVYYLFLFGNARKIIDFFAREERFDLAFKYIVENNIKPDVFVDALLVPCEKVNKIDELKSVIQDFDPSLQKSKNYIFYGCNYFNKTQKYKSLTQWQILMKDYVRAGLTCIKVFLETKEENFKIQCLKIALSYFIEGHNNLQNAVNANPNPSDGQINNPADIAKYLSRIKLQLQIFSQIKFDPIVNYIGLAGPDLDNADMVNYSLFGSKHQQATLATYLILDPKRIELATQVIDNTKLEKTIIILKAAHYIVNLPLERYQDESNKPQDLLLRTKDTHVYQYIVSVQHLLEPVNWDKMMNILVKGFAVTMKNMSLAMKYFALLALPGSKVEGYILLGDLANAFTEAVKLNEPKLVEMVSVASKQRKDTDIEHLCADYFATAKT